MINLRNSPFLWFALMLLMAYATSGFLPYSGTPLHLILVSLIYVAASLVVLVKYQPGKQLWSTAALATIIFAAGIIRIEGFSKGIMPGEPQPQSIRMHGILEVTEVIKERQNGISLRCKSIKLSAEDTSVALPFSDKFLVLQIKESTLEKVLPGDKLLVKGWVSPIKGPLNPHAFDIRTYYKSIGIRHQMSCKSAEVSLHSNSINSLLRITAKWQSALCSIVRNNTSPQVAQLTNALVWGDRTYMDEDIRAAFANSGAMHVLSVSGMHMAIVYSMLYVLLGAPGSGTLLRRLIRFAFYTLAIILYMGLTGACPAVVRSGLMIILFLLGKAMGWNTQIWNLLGFAAFLMLWINPFVMYNIGFQLSFLAMGGILLYAKPIIRFFSFRHLLFQRIWEVTAVSVAAQVFIFPLLLYHFYQFPLTFVASSLVAMPASYVVIFGALLNTCLALLQWSWLWDLFDAACRCFILSMKWMAGLNPGMNYSLPSLANLLLTAMAVIFSAALVYRWPRGKRIAYLLGISAFINLAWHRSVQWQKNELVIYHQYQGLLADIIIHGHCISIRDSLVTQRSIDFASRGNRCFKDVISINSIVKTEGLKTRSLNYIPPLLDLGGYHLLIWPGKSSQEINTDKVTHLLIDGNRDIDDLKNFVCSKTDLLVILPAHLNRYSKTRMVYFFKDNHIRYHDISEQGAFILPL